jgi:uroporphyrinogen-III synthase
VAEAAASSLTGKRIVVTRAVSQSSELFEELLERRAVPTSLPLVSFAPPQDYGPLDAALARLKSFDWVLFTSANAVQSVVARCRAVGAELSPANQPAHVAVVGPATRHDAKKAGFAIDYVAKTHLGVALAEELGERLREKSVFLPRSDRANPDLPKALRLLGAKLTEVVAYRTLPPGDIDRDCVAKVVANQADAVLFFSPSAVHNMLDVIGGPQLIALQDKVVFAAVGPVTASALRNSGIQRIVMAADTTAVAVVDALESHFASSSTTDKTPSAAGAKRE